MQGGATCMRGMCSAAHPEVMQAAALQVLPGHELLHGERLHSLCHLLKTPPPALAAGDPATLLASWPPSPLLLLLPFASLEACDEQAPKCGPEAVPLHLRGCSRGLSEVPHHRRGHAHPTRGLMPHRTCQPTNASAVARIVQRKGPDMRPLLSRVRSRNTGGPNHCTPPFLPEKFPKNSIMRLHALCG